MVGCTLHHNLFNNQHAFHAVYFNIIIMNSSHDLKKRRKLRLFLLETIIPSKVVKKELISHVI
jgi:hypothetical protein